MKHEILEAAKRIQRDVEMHRWSQRKRRKDAVLHLRIEGGVMERIKAEAEKREMSVSDFVRCYLAERFSESQTDESASDIFQLTTAFSEVSVMRDGRCASCGGALRSGSKARLAHGPFSQPCLVCGPCFDGFQGESEGHSTSVTGEE